MLKFSTRVLYFGFLPSFFLHQTLLSNRCQTLFCVLGKQTHRCVRGSQFSKEDDWTNKYIYQNYQHFSRTLHWYGVGKVRQTWKSPEGFHAGDRSRFLNTKQISPS